MRGVCSVWAVFVGGLCGIGLGVILASDLANTHTLLFRCALSISPLSIPFSAPCFVLAGRAPFALPQAPPQCQVCKVEHMPGLW